MYKMIVFDMAGTTVNENNVVHKTLRQVINEAGFNLSLGQVVDEGAGREKLQAIKRILAVHAPGADEALPQKIYEQFIRQLVHDYRYLDVSPQPHAREVFSALKRKGISIVLNTGYNYSTAKCLLDKLNWEVGEEIDGLITSSDVSNSRPDPEMIKLAMHRFGIKDPYDVIKVGDSITDIEEGTNAGCGLIVGITSGAHTLTQLNSAYPDYIIDDLMELLPLLEVPAAKTVMVAEA